LEAVIFKNNVVVPLVAKSKVPRADCSVQKGLTELNSFVVARERVEKPHTKAVAVKCGCIRLEELRYHTVSFIDIVLFV